MHGGDAKAPDPFHQTLFPVVGIDGSQFGLHGFRSIEMVLVVLVVELARQANGGSRVDEPRNHHRGSDHPIGF